MRSARDSVEVEVVVIGGGPAGAATAWHLAAAGHSVLILEREPFPRFHIGESLTGTAGDFIRTFGLESEMERLDFPAKPGVKVIGHDARRAFYVPVLRPTWQVRRAEFDALLLERAREAGAEIEIGTAREVLVDGERVTGVAFTSAEGERRVRCKLLVDASGQSMFLSGQQIAGARRVDRFNRQIAIYSQYQGVVRDEGEAGNATLIFYDQPLHWAWMIPLSATQVSVGVVLPADSFKRFGDSPEAVLRWGAEHLNPDLTRRMRGARRTEPVRASRNYSYRADPFAGDGWLCVGDSYRFIDPIFSFGVSFGLTTAREAARAIIEALGGGDERAALARYAAFCNRGHDAASDLIRYFWTFPAFFPYLVRGEHGGDIIRLLAGDCFEDPPLEASRLMAESLRAYEARGAHREIVRPASGSV